MALLLSSTVCLSVPDSVEHRPLARRMSAPGLTSEAQMRYMLQWFGEFSELQREDFLPVLAAARGDKPDQLAASLATISCDDKPVSLFQCRIAFAKPRYQDGKSHVIVTSHRKTAMLALGTVLRQIKIKLFNEWFPTWAEEDQDRLIKSVSETDIEFGKKLEDLMTNGPQVNGEQNGTNELHSPAADEEKKTEENVTWTNGENGDAVVEENAELAIPENIPVEIAAAS